MTDKQEKKLQDQIEDLKIEVENLEEEILRKSSMVTKLKSLIKLKKLLWEQSTGLKY
jgi:hypothetical protein